MAIIIGNKITGNPTPGSTTTSVPHIHDVGADGLLLVTIGQPNGQSVSSVSYGGDAMTQVHTYNDTTLGIRYTAFKLLAPSTGSNTLLITYSASVVSPIVYYAQSFTGAGDIGAVGIDTLTNSPHQRNITIAENSVIYGAGMSTFTIIEIKIDGVSTVSPNFAHDGSVIGKRFTGALSPVLSAGTKVVEIDNASAAYLSDNFRIEIQEAGVVTIPVTFAGAQTGSLVIPLSPIFAGAQTESLVIPLSPVFAGAQTESFIIPGPTFKGIQAETEDAGDVKFLGIQAETEDAGDVKFLGIQAETDPFYYVTMKGITVEFEVGPDITFKGVTTEFDIQDVKFKGLTVENEPYFYVKNRGITFETDVDQITVGDIVFETTIEQITVGNITFETDPITNINRGITFETKLPSGYAQVIKMK